MSNIECRAWDKIRKKMIDGLPRVCMPNPIETFSDNYFPVIDDFKGHFIIMLYSGLKDRDNNKMFEDDIVKLGLVPYEGIYKVEFKDGVFGCSGKGLFFAVSFFFPRHYTILGNVHQNPELEKEIKKL